MWGKGVRKERDARRFHPFPWDKPDEKKLTVYKVSEKDVQKLNNIFESIRK